MYLPAAPNTNLSWHMSDSLPSSMPVTPKCSVSQTCMLVEVSGTCHFMCATGPACAIAQLHGTVISGVMAQNSVQLHLPCTLYAYSLPCVSMVPCECHAIEHQAVACSVIPIATVDPQGDCGFTTVNSIQSFRTCWLCA